MNAAKVKKIFQKTAGCEKSLIFAQQNFANTGILNTVAAGYQHLPMRVGGELPSWRPFADLLSWPAGSMAD
ncbi:MAG: hypothetical protein LBG47_09580 [Prevotellaceae bacterium]|nr:hypothetical protein [Prevotellaceae bacterium]